MYPFATLPGNLAAFCEALRRRHGFHIGPGELHDAARALDVVDLASEHAVRNALRPILAGTLDDLKVFDAAFTQFFSPIPRLYGGMRRLPHSGSQRPRAAATETPSARVTLRHRQLTQTTRPRSAAAR